MARKNPQRNKNPTGDIRTEREFSAAEMQPISDRGKELVRRAYELFEFFREKHAPAHEEMRQAREMRQLAQPERGLMSPASMTLNSCIDNVIADQIDNMPEAIMVPEREETANTADEMSDVVAFVLYQSGWPGKYQKIMEDAVVTGTGVAQVFWDEDAMNGDGMVSVMAWHPEDFFPDPMYENIQDGRGCFKTTATTVAWVEEHYPDARGYVQSDEIRPNDAASVLADVPDGDAKVTLLEFWYKRYDAEKRRYRVHMAQMAGRALLYSTELGIGCSESEFAQGVYAHGQYPFTLYKYRDVFRKPFGTGLVHDHKGTQHAIDRYQKYIDDNARVSSRPKHFIRRGSGINAEDVADMSKTFVEWDGNDIREVMQTVQAAPLNGQVYQMMTFLVDAMKDDSGQNAFNRGETTGGVTANSAIQSLVAQGNKTTRWHVEQFKDAFREMIEQVLWVMSDYIDDKRVMLIVGGWESGMGMQNRRIEVRFPKNEGDRLLKPAYSVRVQAQKHNPVWSERFNELLMRAAEIASTTGRPIPPEIIVSMLQGFPDKGRIVKALEESGAMYDQIAALQQQIEQMQTQMQEKDALVAGLEDALDSSQGGGAMIAAKKTPNYAQLEAIASQSNPDMV